MITKNEIHKYWSTMVDNFDELCVHTIFNTKVLVINLGNRHGTRCAGYVDIITIDGKYIARYPGKSIVESFEAARSKNKLLRDLLLKARLNDAGNKIKEAEQLQQFDGGGVPDSSFSTFSEAWREWSSQRLSQVIDYRYIGEAE